MPIDSAKQPEHFDPAALRRDLFDSTPALLNVLHTFNPWLTDMHGQLRVAVEAANTTQIAGIIHTLRGGLAQLRAQAAVDLVRQLEAACKANPTAPLPSDHPSLLALETELEALSVELTQFLLAVQAVVPPQQT
ncbi:Hpt domain-containing protein [Thauera sp.]|jgi:HPt (histidine-containing phosphotransfer) domain-containing protein|uniref:Hpt domain-containing protein n=1 Tax=Thauera sp. TaxID=1905334 RepID=UPI002A36A94E|nr:Hpt domain-containing protein [Thauera sp.]MDX9887089.1 Hpt domain-containing protein [Thauera sp.]